MTTSGAENTGNPRRPRRVTGPRVRDLALRWQVEEQWPALSIIQSKIHIRELEDAIVRVEAGVAGSSGRESREPAAAGLKAGRQSRKAPVKSEEDEAPNVVMEPHPQPRGPRPDLEAGEGGGSPEPPKASEFNAIRQIPDAPIETRKDEADFRIVRQLEDAIARFTSQQKRNAPVESEEDVAPNEIAASHQQSPGPRPVERADLRADAAGRGGRRSREPAKAAAGLNASRQSRSNRVSSRMLSMIAQSRVFRSTTLRAIVPSASSAKLRSTLSISNSRWYYLTSSWARPRCASVGSSRASRMASTGSRPTNSGIRPILQEVLRHDLAEPANRVCESIEEIY